MLRRSLVLLAAPALLLFHCGETIDNVCDYNNACAGDGGADGKLDGSGDTGIDAPPGCDLTKEPKDSLACVADSVGVFVSGSTGDDAAGDGSKAKPFKTIGKGLEKVGNRPRIYVCEGTYAEDVVLDASHDGVSLYGGWKCADWGYSGGKPVVGKGVLALKIDSVKTAITVADFDVKSADATVAGGSSVAVFVNSSDKVSLVRDKLEAGAGKTGDNGTVTAFTYPLQSDLDGKNASGGTGGAANPVICPGVKTTTGGKGGDNGFKGDDGLPALGAGLGGTAGSCGGSGTGKDGTPASAAATGDGAKILGLVDPTGWKPAGGLKGTDGAPGQGGGGGYGSGGGGGGGGGAGGCGGAAGGNGAGGGGSVALVSSASGVTITASELVATAAGDGGNGLAGQLGQPIFGFHGNGAAAGCQGGAGGPGGNGGSGGGGAGGISVGALWKGLAAPTIDASTTSKITLAAKGGNKGLGGTTPTNDGIDGVAQAVLEVK